AIDDVGVSAACAPLPAVALAVTDAEARLVAVRIANLLKSGIVVYCDEIVGVVAVTAAAFLRSRPSAMVAVPRGAAGIDLDAEHLERLVFLAALGRASRTRPAVLAGLVIREPDAVALKEFLRGHHAHSPCTQRP